MVRLLQGVVAFVSVILGTAQASTFWNIEKVHEPRYFRIDQRSMVTDAAGNSHLFYGGSHLYHVYYNGSQWLRETIDSSPRTGSAASVVKDFSGNFHVLYLDRYLPIKDGIALSAVVKYATNVSGQWVIEQLPWIPFCDNWCALAVDSSGRPHIAYYDDRKIMHAVKHPNGWQSEMVDENTNFSPRGELSLVTDSNNFVHVVYRRTTIEQNLVVNYLMYATNATGVWVNKKIDSRSTAFAIIYEHNSLVLDENDHAHVAYLGIDGVLYYANNSGGVWATQAVDDSTRPDGQKFNGKFPSIELDLQGKVHISYTSAQSNPAAEIIRYATNLSGAWELTSIETVGYSSTNTTLNITSSGTVNIAYFDGNSRSLRYSTNHSSVWISDSIDTSEEGEYLLPLPDFRPVGVYSSLIRDNQGKLHVSYVQAGTDTLRTVGQDAGALMYANNVSGTWSAEYLFSGFGTITQTAVAIDTNGKVHIAFFSSFGLDLNYITNRNGTWELTKLETINNSDPDYKAKIGIAVDDSNHVHIAYFRNLAGFATNADLRYATNRSGAWQIETVTTITAQAGFRLGTDGSAALTLDPSGRAHIGYLDGIANVSHATNVSGAWVIKTIATYNRLRAWGAQSMVVEPTGAVHMAFESIVCTVVCYSAGIEYASNATGSWEREFVDDDTYVDLNTFAYSEMGSPALTLESGGKPHISYLYRDFPNGPHAQNLRYAHKLGTLWRISIIESDLYVGEYNTMATDANGNVMIAYHDEPNGSLKLASSVAFSSSMINVLISPDNLDFGDTQLSVKASRLITLENIGQLSLDVLSVVLDGGTSVFALDFDAGPQPCGSGVNFTLVSGSHCTFALVFTPAVSGQFSTLLLIESNDPELPLLGGVFTGNGINPGSGGGGGGGGGGGCAITDADSIDPTLALLLILSFMMILRRRYATFARST